MTDLVTTVSTNDWRPRVLPRPVAVGIAIVLTLAELVNIVGQVFLGSGDTAIHVMYPAVLGALGLTTKKAEEESVPDGRGTEEVADGYDVDEPTPIRPAARHRQRGGDPR